MALSAPTPSSSLAPLVQAFQRYLVDTNLYPGLEAIEGKLETGRLVITAQHPLPEIDDPRGLLKDLEMVFRELMPEVGLPDSVGDLGSDLPVRICLQLRQAKRPYATHTFTWCVDDAVEQVFPVFPADAAGDGPAETDALSSLTDHNGHGSRSAVGGGPPPLAPSYAALVPFTDAVLALPEAHVQSPSQDSWRVRWRPRGVTLSRFLGRYWSYGVAGLILVSSGVFAYTITRPCVVGSCIRLDKADEFYQSAQNQLNHDPDAETLQMAQTEMQGAIDLLSPIPKWSSHYGVAQQQLTLYRQEIVALNLIQQGKELATKAANQSQNPPHPVERWVDIHLLWQQAIDKLETVPADSPTYAYTQRKLEEYRAYYNTIGRRITAEEEAEANFNTALQTAQLAQQRMATAESLAGWQLAVQEWQAAIHGLDLIPQGTQAYPEAQLHLKDYRQELLRAQGKAHQEENSARNYHQAIQTAQQAEGYEAKQQWTLAVTNWKQALAYAQAVPAGTTLAKEAETLVGLYQPALANAQHQLQTAVALQQLKQIVANLCQGSATPCTVTTDPNQVSVTVIAQYAQALRQAITPPAPDGTFGFTNQLSPDAQTLIDAIMTASRQIDDQIAVYDAQGGFIARYRPDLGGFQKN